MGGELGALSIAIFASQRSRRGSGRCDSLNLDGCRWQLSDLRCPIFVPTGLFVESANRPKRISAVQIPYFSCTPNGIRTRATAVKVETLPDGTVVIVVDIY